MDVDSAAALGGAAATICIVEDDPSNLKALISTVIDHGAFLAGVPQAVASES
jgi:hypothetical protein